MSYQDSKKGQQLDAPKVHKIRITLTSRKVTALEKVCLLSASPTPLILSPPRQ